MKQREKSVIVLEGLFQGQEIALQILPNEKLTVGLSEDNRLYFNGVRVSNGTNYETVPLLLDMSVNEFIKVCNKLTDDEVAIIAANTTLTKTNKQKRKDKKGDIKDGYCYR